MPIVRIQCLLFVKSRTELEVASKASTSITPAPKGYALVAREFTNHTACEIFTRNNIQVITDDQVTPPQTASFEVIETLLDRISPTSSPEAFRLYTDYRNLDFVERLLTISLTRHDHFITNFRPTELRSAITAENLRVIENFLTAGATFRYSHHRGGSLLHFAAEKGYETLINLLLNHRADVNTNGHFGTTPLHVVAETAHLKVARLLLEQGANIEAKMKDGSSPLHLATERGVLDMVKLLVVSGADFESRRSDGFTPLHIATDRGQCSTINILLERGANVNSAVESNLPLNGATPLILAIKRKRCDTMRLLLENGADVNSRCANNQSALYFAVSGGHLGTIEYFLRHQPNLNDMTNRKAFQLAFRKNGEQSRASVEKLLEYGFAVGPADVNEPDFLFGAIHKNLPRVVQELLNYGADVNKFHSFLGLKLSPLHLAAHYAREDVIRLLLDHGANVHARRGLRRFERTPLLDAVANINADAVRLLLANNASIMDYPNLLHIAVRMRSPQIVESLLESGAALNATCTDGHRTPISIAVFDGQAKVVQVLMKFGAPFDLQHLVGDRSESYRAYLDYGFVDMSSTAETFFKRCLNDYARRNGWTPVSLDPLYSRYYHVAPVNCARILLHHVLKVEAAFESIRARDIIPNVCYELFGLDDFRSKCVVEIASMKVESIGGTSVTVFDILTRGVKGIVRYVTDEKVKEALESYDFYVRYPIYGSILACHFRQGTLRRSLVTIGLTFFNLFFEQFSALPLELKEEVLNHLSNQDLIILQKCMNVK